MVRLPRPRASILIPLALLAFALLLRMTGVDWHGRHPDEDISGPARLLAGDLRVQSFYYPPLLTYLVAIAYIPLYGLGRVLGWWHSSAEFRAAYFADPTTFLVTARTVVALCSACAAPIAWALARQVGLSHRAAVLTGLVVAMLPGAVYWAHIAKSDSGIGPACLLVGLCVLRALEQPRSVSRAALVGVAIAIAISFKQSAIFFLAPSLGLFALWSLRTPRTRATSIRSWSIALLATLIAAAILNIGILLDPKPFLAGQAVQSQMSFRAAPLSVIIGAWIAPLLSPDTGLPMVTLLVGALLWAIGATRGTPATRLLLIVFAIAWVVATIIICSITGSRQPPHLWLPYLVIGSCAAALGAGTLVDTHTRSLRYVGYAAFVLLLCTAAIRIVPILTQATAPAMGGRIATIVRSIAPPGTRLVSNIDLAGHLPLSPESQTLPRARNERLARRYGIVLPPPERPLGGTRGGYTVVDYPWVIGGLESYRPDQVKVILPYAWPLQPEEWQLANWQAQGFHLFVVAGATERMKDPTPAYRAFFRTLDRCDRVATVPTVRPLFGEQDSRIYRCP